MGTFDQYMLCSDVDGTLSWEGKISQENRDAIRHFEENGGHFVISTGRFPSFVQESLKLELHCPVISVNGTVIYDLKEQKILFAIPMKVQTLEICRKFALRNTEHLQSIHINRMMRGSAAASLQEMEQMLAEEKKGPEDEIYKIVYVFDSDENALRARENCIREFGKAVAAERSWSVGVELHEPGSGKDVCMNFLKKQWGIQTAAAVGDYENDITMIKAADIGYAVGNALPEVKAAADVLAPACREHAIAWVIADLEKRSQA